MIIPLNILITVLAMAIFATLDLTNPIKSRKSHFRAKTENKIIFLILLCLIINFFKSPILVSLSMVTVFIVMMVILEKARDSRGGTGNFGQDLVLDELYGEESGKDRAKRLKDR